MGKKKHKKHGKHGGEPATEAFTMPPQVIGIAATIARQVATPQARQMLAGVLFAAAGAIARGGGNGVAKAEGAVPPVPPRPPVPPVPPAPPVPPVASIPPEVAAPPEPPTPAYAPAPATPHFDLPPEAARVIGAVTSGLERWMQGMAKPKPPSE